MKPEMKHLMFSFQCCASQLNKEKARVKNKPRLTQHRKGLIGNNKRVTTAYESFVRGWILWTV